jgi:hypothetical protein
VLFGGAKGHDCHECHTETPGVFLAERGITAALQSSPGVIRRMVKGASAAAEDLNVEPFQGIVEVMQNADDLGARNLRIALVGQVSIDAQFDPSAAREALIDNPWNKWLITQCGAAVSLIARYLLITRPAAAWSFVPTLDESIGPTNDKWPTLEFGAAFANAREEISAAEITVARQPVALTSVVYESVILEGFLTAHDIRLLKPDSTPLTGAERDASSRWRRVLKDLGGAAEVGTAELAAGFRDELFGERNIDWWIAAGDRLTAQHVTGGLFGVPCWMTDHGKPVAIVTKGATARKLVIGDPLSEFATRWNLFERLHERYRDTTARYKHASATNIVARSDSGRTGVEREGQSSSSLSRRRLRPTFPTLRRSFVE